MHPITLALTGLAVAVGVVYVMIEWTRVLERLASTRRRKERMDMQVGPIGYVLREVGEGNPGAMHLLEELAEAKRRLREYEGMMTRRECLERIVGAWLPEGPKSFCEDCYEDLQWIGNVMGGLYILGIARTSEDIPGALLDAAHELALMMNEECGEDE